MRVGLPVFVPQKQRNQNLGAINNAKDRNGPDASFSTHCLPWHTALLHILLCIEHRVAIAAPHRIDTLD